MFSNELWQKSGVSTYSIDQSIRFNQSDSAYLTKTFGGSASNRRTHTYSFWLKLGANAAGANSSGGCFFISTDDSGGNAGDYFHLNGDLKLRYWSNESSASTFETTQLFRDFSAWYHIVLVNDRDNAVGSEAVRLYVNGQRVTSFAVNNISGRKSQDTMVNASSFLWMIQRFTSGTVHGDAYMAEIVFLDGTATDCNSFGEFNDSGIWIPKDVSGLTSGTNGFHIDGRDSADLGDDESGNGNDYTASGLAAHDQVSDSPTNNFAVLNPVDTHGKLAGELRNGNLELKDNGASVYVYGRATFGFDVTDSNGFYWESCDVVDGSGIGGITEDNTALPSGSSLAFTGARGYNSLNTSNHYKLENTTFASVDLGVASNAGDIVQFCVKNGKLFIGINGTYVLSGNPATEANPLFTGLTGIFMPFAGLYSAVSYNTVYNFGQDGTFAGNKTAQGNTDANDNGNFFYAPPSGAKALCSKSLGS